MVSSLAGKVAIVTGGAGGIGGATCLLLAERGTTVSADIAAAGGMAVALALDIASEPSIAP